MFFKKKKSINFTTNQINTVLSILLKEKSKIIEIMDINRKLKNEGYELIEEVLMNSINEIDEIIEKLKSIS